MNRHPELSDLERLAAGDLTDAESERYLRHLARCESCLEIAETAWTGLGALTTGEEERRPLGQATADDIERRLFHRIHVAGTGTQLAWLATDGFVRVLVVLLRPFVAAGRELDKRGPRP